MQALIQRIYGTWDLFIAWASNRRKERGFIIAFTEKVQPARVLIFRLNQLETSY